MNTVLIPRDCGRCGRTVSLLDTTVTGELCDVCAHPRPQRPHPGEHLLELAKLLVREGS